MGSGEDGKNKGGMNRHTTMEHRETWWGEGRGSARDAALATCVQFVGFFAFLISLSSVN